MILWKGLWKMENKNNHCDPEEIEQLKRDLYSYEFHKKQIKKLYINGIIDINAKIEGLYKKRQSEIKGGRTSTKVYRNMKEDLITKKDELYKAMRNSVDYKATTMIDNIMVQLSDSDKDLIRDKFFYNKTYSEIAHELFISKSVVIDRIDSVLRKMIKVKKMTK